MKTTLLFLVSLFSLAAFSASAPSYTVKSSEILGKYTLTNENDYFSKGDSLEVKFIQNEDSLEENKLVVYFLDAFDYPVDVFEDSGSLQIDDFQYGECDDPGCGYISGISGKITSTKVGDSYVPSVQMTLTYTYDYPEYEGDREGDVEVNLEFVFSEKIEDTTPLARQVELDSRLTEIIKAGKLADMMKGSSTDFLKVRRTTRMRFKKGVTPKVGEASFKKVFENSGNWVKLEKEDIQTLVFENAKYHLKVFKVNAKLKGNLESKEIQDKAVAYEEYLFDLASYLHSDDRLEIYMTKPYRELSKSSMSMFSIYLVHPIYRSVTTLDFDNQ